MMHEPIQAKGLTMSEKLMEQCRLRKQRKRRNACIAAIVTVVLVLAVAGGVWWTAGDGSVLVRNMFKPKATPATQPVVDSTAAFAYRTAPEFLAMGAGDRDTGNVNYSPASMWMALAIAAQGANGTTRSQLNELLDSGSLADSDYQSLLRSINGQYSGAKSEMSAANSLWIDNDYSLASDYQSTVKKIFEAEVTTLPFDDQAAAKMSDWIAKHTNGSLKPKITLRDREVLSIINSVYADGRWKDPFEEQSTGDGTFHGEAGDAQVPMMHRAFSQMAYGHDEYNTWQRVEIPFDNGGNLAIVLPAEGHFDELAGDAQKLGWAFGTCSSASLGEGAMGCAADSMPGWGVSVNSATVNVTLPRFTIDSMFDSEATIKAFEKLGGDRCVQCRRRRLHQDGRRRFARREPVYRLDSAGHAHRGGRSRGQGRGLCQTRRGGHQRTGGRRRVHGGPPIPVLIRHPGRHTIIHRCGAQPRRSRWRKLMLSQQSVN